MTSPAGESPEITPRTTVGGLLSAHPELEAVLIARSPAFARLKNPVLRRTIAKVATLAQAAAMAGLHPLELVNELRRAAGQPPLSDQAIPAADSEPGDGEAPPAWLDQNRIAARIDADVLLGRGENPAGEVFRRAAALGEAEILAVESSFLPAPLMEALRGRGCEVWVRKEGGDRYVTYLRSSRNV